MNTLDQTVSSRNKHHDTRDLLSEIRHKQEAISKALQDVGQHDESGSIHHTASAFHDTIRVKAFFNKMAAKDDHTRILPLSESHVAVDISRIEQATATAEDARERIESLKIDRSSSAFLKALKSDHELWLMFLEFFNTEEAFLNLLEKRRYASVLSGLMKAFIDHDVYLEHKKKDKKLREDAEFVENHKAYALAKSKGFDLNPIVSLQAKQPALQQSNKSLSGKYRSNATLLDPHDAADKELIRTLASPRTESHQYELVTETKRPTETQCPSSTRVLPKYDLERIKQMATEAESEAKASQTRASRHYKPVLASQKAFAEDTKHPRHRLSDARPQELGTEHHSDMKAYHQGDQFVPGSPNRENSPSKLHMKRQEFKQRKSGQKSSSNSPESQKEQARSDSEKKLTFMEKMMNFDYSNLRKPRIETDNQITSKLAQDKKNRQLSREKRVEDIASADEHSKSPKQSGARPGRYAHAHSDEEMKVNHKKRDDHLLEYSDNDDDPLGFPPGTFPKHKVPGMRNSSPGYPPRSPDQYSNKSNNISQNASKQADATRPSAVSRDKKKLTPLVPDSEKSDVYSKVQKHLNQKEHEQKAPQGGLNKSQEEKPRSASGGSRPPRERRHPNVDHRNPEYVPAHLKEQKRYLAELEKPSYKSVKSSNYGKIEPNKDGSSKGEGGRRSPSPAFKDVRSLVDSILHESKMRSGIADHSKYIWDDSKMDKSRLKGSFDRSAEKSFGSMKSNSPVRSDFGKEERGDLYERRKLDPLTTHQQKRHFPERDQFINTSNALIAK